MDEFQQAAGVVERARDRATSQLALATASAVAAVALPQSRSLFVSVTLFALGAAVYYLLAMCLAIEQLHEIGDRLAVEGIPGLAGHAEWLGRARTQHHVAVELRRMHRSARQEACLSPSEGRLAVDRTLGRRLARLADRLDREAGRLPPTAVAQTRLFIARTYPLVLMPPEDEAARERAVCAALEALDRIEAELDAARATPVRAHGDGWMTD